MHKGNSTGAFTMPNAAIIAYGFRFTICLLIPELGVEISGLEKQKDELEAALKKVVGTWLMRELIASQSKMYFARMRTKVGFCRVRLPFSSFPHVKPDDPPLDPFLVHTLTIRFEPRRQVPPRIDLSELSSVCDLACSSFQGSTNAFTSSMFSYMICVPPPIKLIWVKLGQIDNEMLLFLPQRQAEGGAPAGVQQDLGSFKLIMEYIKALPIDLTSQIVWVITTLKGLPVDFCKKYLPQKDETIILIDEDMDESPINYLALKRGLRAGWRGFAIAHDLVDGDAHALIFQLVETRIFKVLLI
ncbi:hypothetical protein GIB67_033837 [Kingdonia uniflora]|uniref:TF-B3 domain-containing protein n=1 Tax=Kingdonia uniflora TaxID=39325 RepID=A0A7J7LIR6_9MAGN|nr:hypothetical protein GIB67_033837 [Kingdonia uniflora]